MKFNISKSISINVKSKYEYLKGEFSISFLGEMCQSSGGVLIGDISLELDKEGYLLFASGLCPFSLWKEEYLELPKYSSNRVSVSSREKLSSGMYIRVDDKSRWQSFVDKESKLLCIGDPNSKGQSVCFSPGVLLTLSNGLPTALWFYDIKGLPE